MTILARHTATFTVHGANEPALHDEIRRELTEFARDPAHQWRYTLHAEPAATSSDGIVQMWQAEVNAWRVWSE